MRPGLAAVFAVALGCSSSSFELAEQPDAQGPDDTSRVADDGQTGTDSATPPNDAPSPSDADLPPRDSASSLDAADPVEAGPTACARTGDCPTNQFCKFQGCVTVGVCQPLSPQPGPYFDPVCGCDGSTFWNKEFAYVNSVPITHEGPCVGSERKTCTALGGPCDTPDSFCVGQLPNAMSCAISALSGGCWRLPAGTACGDAGGPPMLSCAGTTCMSLCTAVKSKKAFYPASCVPG